VRRWDFQTLIHELWLALRTSAWLCSVPLYLRSNSLPALLARIKMTPRSRRSMNHVQTERAVRIAIRISHLRLFRSPIFPRHCVRQTLALAYALSRIGQAFTVHFGVRKEGQGLCGHCWITMQEHPVGERAPAQRFTVVYSYASESTRGVASSSG
jgi:hypothetical protein